MLYCPTCKKSQLSGGETEAKCPVCGTLMLAGKPLTAGTIINGFTIIREIGRGGMGIVYLAKQDSLGRSVALKVLDDSLIKDVDFVNGFFREARAAASLNHPNIVQAYDAGISDGNVYYFVMELIDGQDLDHYIMDHGKLEVDMGIRIVRKIAEALEYASEHHLCHGDIKPENIILKANGEPKLADLGLARDYKKDKLTPGEIMATPAYAPPEIIRGELEKIDFKSDMYSFGATLYHLFSGLPPFPGDDPSKVCAMQLNNQPKPLSAVNSKVPTVLSELVDKLMEKAPSHRPDSWHYVAAVLATLAEGKKFPEQESEEPPAEQKKTSSVSKAVLFFILFLILTLSGVIVFFVLKQEEETIKPVQQQTETYVLAPSEVLEDRARHSEARAKWSVLQNELRTLPVKQGLDQLIEYRKNCGEYAVPDSAIALERQKKKYNFELAFIRFQKIKKTVMEECTSAKKLNSESIPEITALASAITQCLNMAKSLFHSASELAPEKLPLLQKKEENLLMEHRAKLNEKKQLIIRRRAEMEQKAREKKQQKIALEQNSLKSFNELETIFFENATHAKDSKKILSLCSEWESKYKNCATQEQVDKLAKIRILVPGIALSDAKFLHEAQKSLKNAEVLPDLFFVDADSKGVICDTVKNGSRIEVKRSWNHFKERKGNFRTLSVALCSHPAILKKLTKEEQTALFLLAVSEKESPDFYSNLIHACSHIPENEQKTLLDAANYYFSGSKL